MSTCIAMRTSRRIYAMRIHSKGGITLITDTTPAEYRPDTVTISAEEYADLVRAAAQLDAILILSGSSKNPLYAAIARERNLVRTEG